MPRNVRNAWIEVRVDGKAQLIATGPRAADGGMSATLRIRQNGAVVEALKLEVNAASNGRITTFVTICNELAEQGVTVERDIYGSAIRLTSQR